MKIYYRISNNSYRKNRLSNATKENCLENFLHHFNRPENQINIIADNVTDVNLSKFIDSILSDTCKRENTALNNAHSFRHCLHRAFNEAIDSELVYFAEDDYLYTTGSFNVLKEGLSISNYVTLYDHPDKYIDGADGGNPQIENGGEITRLVKTETTHWKLTNSTTMTFGTTGATIKKDINIWNKYLETSYPKDYDAFCELIQIHGRSLISCIPGRATHSEIPWLSPFTNWELI
jgi:hypothetical protein